MIVLLSGCRKKDHYQVYAVKYLDGSIGSASNIAMGADPNDSVRYCFMVWLLKGDNGKTILVDAGYIDSSSTADAKYVRPDLVLQRMNVSPSEITDLILTHPHWDHIGGITLFPKATVWMQKADFEYYIGGKWQADGHSEGFTTKNIPDILNVKSEGRLKLVEVIDPVAYVDALKRMKTLVSDPDLIIPGHDELAFSRFPKVADWIVKIEKK